MRAATTPARRSFLVGLTAALTAPAVATIPASATGAVRAGVVESPELLALGERLDTLTAEFEAAITRKDEAVAAYERMRPAYPPEIITRDDYPLADIAIDVFGNATIWNFRGVGLCPLRLYRSHRVQALIIGERISRHTKKGKALRHVVRVAKKFEKDEAAARSASEVKRCMSDVPEVEVCELFDEIIAHAPRTMAGVLIFARAAGLYREAMNWRKPLAKHPSDYVVEALLQVEAGKVA